jgi:CRISPR-associated endoribonuclease Cas6
MLIAIVLQLEAPVSVRLPLHLGRANHAAALRLIGSIDPALAAAVHDDEGPKPLTCSGLLGVMPGRDGVALRAGQACAVRLTGLNRTVGQALEEGLLRGTLPARWELEGVPFRITGATCDPTAHGWSGRSSCEQLAGAALVEGGDGRTVTLEFASPTAFKSAGYTVPVPMPALVFGSLVERWNHFAPLRLSGEMRRFADEMMVISRYRLESRAVAQKNDAWRIGGVGTVTYRSMSGDRYWLGVLHALAGFALYSGVGVQTATGMGQARAQVAARVERRRDDA